MDPPEVDHPFRLPVQSVIRPHSAAPRGLEDFRGYAGQVAAGAVAVGDEVLVLPSGRATTVVGIHLGDRPLGRAVTGQSVTLELADDIDVSRGDLLTAPDGAPEPTREIGASLAWLSDRPLRERDRVLVKHGTRTIQAVVASIAGSLDLDDLTLVPADSLELNDIGRVRLRLAEAIPVAPYERSRTDGAFLVIDAHDGWTLAAGMARGADEADRTDRARPAPSREWA